MSARRLRVHIITEEDPFYLPVFFAEFLARVPKERIEITGLDITPPLNQSGMVGLARRLYAFYGPVDFLRLALRYGASKAKDLMLPRERWHGTVVRLAHHHGIASADVADVNAPEYVARLRSLDLDLLISVAASQIFKVDLLSVPRLHAINIHTGRLPDYRGMLPVFWQLYDGQPSLGITIHTMTPEIDRGEVLLARSVDLEGVRSLDDAIRRGKLEGARAMLELLEGIGAGSVRPVPMPTAKGRYRSFPKREHAARFRAAGGRLL